jgi:hypothetical protein
MEKIKADIRFALTQQKGQEFAALDGDGHTLVEPDFFIGKVPRSWNLQPLERVLHAGTGKHQIYQNGEPVDELTAIYLLDFHLWVGDIARSADPELENTWGSYGGRGFMAQAVVRALTEWVKEDTYVPEQATGGEA